MYLRETTVLLLVLCMCLSVLGASVPPLPQEVASTVKSMFLSGQDTQLQAYINILHTSYPDYIPSVLAAGFSGLVYNTDTYSGILGKLARVQQWVGTHQTEVSDSLVHKLTILEGLIQFESRELGSEESLCGARPDLLRETYHKYGEDMFFPLTILFDAPNATITGTLDTNPFRVNLRITEIMYNPEGSDTYEFVELQNIGVGPLSLKGLSFASPSSITFAFTASQVETLGPGEYVLVVADLAAFKSRYGEVMASRVAGQYSGSLSDSGGRIVLKDAQAQVVTDFSYADAWYSSPEGYSCSSGPNEDRPGIALA